MKKRIITVNDKMQKGYVYECTEPVGKHFHPDFKPMLTPQEMLEQGVFGGRYIRDCRAEFPKSWFKNAKLHELGIPGHNKKLNFFGVDASQSIGVWRQKGWINNDHDPRGWFQWYCRYYMGRRLFAEDTRQIKRWIAMRRHAAQIVNKCKRGDFSCNTKQRQALLHWAYDSRRM